MSALDDVTIRLSQNEALVLSELLARWFERGEERTPSAHFSHESERILLEIVLTGQLEKQVVALFARDYVEQVATAQRDVAARYGTSP